MICTAKQAIKAAKKWVGYLEKRSNGNLKSKTANAGVNNYTYFGYVMHNAFPATMDFPAPWCDCFFDYCIFTACKNDAADTKTVLCGYPDDYTVNSANYYKKAGRFGQVPKLGAQIFFSSNGLYSGICHTGIVVSFDSSSVTTIEGNTSGGSSVVANGGGVHKKTYKRSNSRIAGYGYPKYKTKKKKAANANSVACSYVVTASELNIRSKRNTKTGEVVARVARGTKLELCNVKKNSVGNTWAEIASGKYQGRFIAVKFKGQTLAKRA